VGQKCWWGSSVMILDVKMVEGRKKIASRGREPRPSLYRFHDCHRHNEVAARFPNQCSVCDIHEASLNGSATHAVWFIV
jgi:hypothetical protein